MEHSELLKDLLARAEQIHLEGQTEHLSAPCIVVAVMELCATEYRGITKYDPCFYPEWYEEERLRYLCRKLFRGSGQLAGNYIKKKLKNEFAAYDRDFMAGCADSLEQVAQVRGKNVLSADVVFATAVQALMPEHRVGVHPEYKGAFSALEVLAVVDGAIYDFVIGEIGKIQVRLEAKAAEVRAKRDWRPAAKFVEPEELTAHFLASTVARQVGDDLEITLPYFFGEEDGELRLTIRCADIAFVHDNGCALGKLRKHTGTEERFQAVLAKIGANVSREGDQIIGAFSQVHGFFHYLQMLILIAHADLYWEHLDEEGLPCDPGIVFAKAAGKADAQALIDGFCEAITARYDENTGLVLALGMTYAFHSTWAAYRIETLDDGSIRISDHAKGHVEGEVFESFYWDHEDPALYRQFITGFCRRFGVDFDGKDVSLTAANEGSDDFARAMFRFINLAVLLSEVGRRIELPEL